MVMRGLRISGGIAQAQDERPGRVRVAVQPAQVAGAAAKLDVAYASVERILTTTFLTEGGRRYLQGGPEDTCAYAFIQEPRVSAVGERLQIRFLFAARAGKEVASKCVTVTSSESGLELDSPKTDALAR